MPLSPAIVARASNTSAGPAPGKWTVTYGKSDGVTPGFTIRDTAGQLWFVKFDPPGWRAMATGSEIVAAKLFWAVGYHTAEYHIGQLVPSNLEISKDATVEPPGEMRRGDEPGRHPVAAVARRSGSGRQLSRHPQQGGAGPRRSAASSSTARAPTIRTTSSRTSIAASCAAISSSRRGSITSTRRASTRSRRSSPRTAAGSSDTTCSISDRRWAAPPSGRVKAGKATKRSSKNRAKSASARCRSASTFRCGGRRTISSRPRSAACRAITRSGIPRSGGRTSRTLRSATCVRTTPSGRRRNSPRSATR